MDVGLKGGRGRDKEEAKHARTNKESPLGIAHSCGILGAGHEGLLNYLKVFTSPFLGRFCSFYILPLSRSRN